MGDEQHDEYEVRLPQISFIHHLIPVLSGSLCQSNSLLIHFNSRHGFSNDIYVEFSNVVQDQIIGTKDDYAHVGHASCTCKSHIRILYYLYYL